MMLDNGELEEKLNELYMKNVIVRHTLQSGRIQGAETPVILANMVIALASHNKELQDQLLKIEIKRPISRNIVL